MRLPEPGERCQGWQHHGFRACSTSFLETELLPVAPPVPCSLGPALPLGLTLSLPSHLTPGLLHRADAWPMAMAAAVQSTFTAITTLSAPTPVSSPASQAT